MKKCTAVISDILNSVNEHKAPVDRICGVLLAFVPLLQHYTGLVDNAASTLLMLLVPWLALRMLGSLRELKWSRFAPVLVLMAFFLYKLVDHGTFFSEIAQVCLMLGFLAAVAMGCIDLKAMTATAGLIAAAAGALILVQYACFYILGFHLKLVPTGWLLPESAPWILGAETGLGAITGKMGTLYRPSAFFLEPSHLFLYSFPMLFVNLLGSRRTRKSYVVSLLITAGLVLSTSGMGIAAAGAGWALFFALWNEREDSIRLGNMFRKRNLIMMGTLVVGALLAIAFVPFLRSSVMRIFYNPQGSTAIAGRTNRAMELVGSLRGMQWLFGAGDVTNAKFNVPGFFSTFYRYGIIGLVLSYHFYVHCLLKLDAPWFFTSGLILVVSLFSAHTHGTFFMLYYVYVLMEGHETCTGQWREELMGLLRRIGPKRKGDR